MRQCQPCLKGQQDYQAIWCSLKVGATKGHDSVTMSSRACQTESGWGETSLKILSFCLVMQVRSFCEKAKEILMQENNVQVFFCAYCLLLEFLLCQTMTILWQSTNWSWDI
jgi:hypothetical protein